jgi:hypothetical protein
MPHFFVTFRTRSGAPIKLLEIFNDDMFTGKKAPSRPDAKSNQVFI